MNTSLNTSSPPPRNTSSPPPRARRPRRQTLLRHPGQRRPLLTPWRDACSNLQNRSSVRSAGSLVRRAVLLALGGCGSTNPHRKHRCVLDAVTRLRNSGLVADLQMSLGRRGVICSTAASCTVDLSDDAILTLCLPAEAGDARVCEPYGEPWQQLGATITSSASTTAGTGHTGHCHAFELDQIGAWLAKRERSHPLGHMPILLCPGALCVCE
jgi:hypothetical protein